jgi:hypothetical protein
VNYAEPMIHKYKLKELYIKYTQSSEPPLTQQLTNKKIQCRHVLTRGVNTGKQCSTTVKNGGKYCSKHKKNYKDDDGDSKLSENDENKSLDMDLDNISDEDIELDEDDIEDDVVEDDVVEDDIDEDGSLENDEWISDNYNNEDDEEYF